MDDFKQQGDPTSGPGDSGIVTGFWVGRNAYAQQKSLTRALGEVAEQSAGEELRDYYGFDHVPTWTELTRHWKDEEEAERRDRAEY